MNRYQFKDEFRRNSDPAPIRAGDDIRYVVSAKCRRASFTTLNSTVGFETAVVNGMILHAATTPPPSLVDTALVAYYLNLI